MTLYEALENFRDLYELRLSDSSRRISDPIATDWQRISNEFDLYYEAIALGDYTSADEHITNIINILNGYGIIVDEPSQGPLPININAYPGTIFVTCDSGGTPITYVGSYSDIIIREGGTDTTSNWTFSVFSVTNVTANISGGNRLNITSLTSTSGEVTIRGTRTGYTNQDFIVTILKSLQGSSGGVTDIVFRQSALTSSNIEQINSVGYARNSSSLGIGNINGTKTDEGYLVDSINSTSSELTIDSTEGDLTSYFVATNKIVVFYKVEYSDFNTLNIPTIAFEYFIGTVVSSAYTTNTVVTFTADITLTSTIEDFINTYATSDNIFVISYSASTVINCSSIAGHLNRNLGRFNNLYGIGNKTANNFVNMFGYFSNSTTNGEISFSSSSSSIRKSIFLLEGVSSSTDEFALKTLSRGINGENTYEEEIYIPELMSFSFTVEIISLNLLGYGERKRYTGVVTRNLAILAFMNGGSVTELTDYSIGSGLIGVTINPNNTTKRLEILVTPSATNLTYWLGWVEGVFMDYPTS